jgi:Tfp pilus assembly protein PilN
MINLLPPESKQSYHYAAQNVSLLRWMIAFAVGLVGLGIIATAGFVYIHQSTQNYASQVSDKEEALQEAKLAETQAKAQDITNSFKLVVQVLSKQVLFSKLLEQIAAIIPSNANLTDLNIAQAQGAIDLTAVATDYSTATQVQINMADPDNKIFAKADIINITCAATSASDPRYPCTVTVRALFADNNPFLFINTNKATYE